MVLGYRNCASVAEASFPALAAGVCAAESDTTTARPVGDGRGEGNDKIGGPVVAVWSEILCGEVVRTREKKSRIG